MAGPRVMIVAGEASGDRHGAGLVRQALALAPELRFEGVGGGHLERAGVHLHHHAKELAVVGFSEVLAHLPEIRGALKDLRRQLREDPPAALVLVDFPDFNLMLAKTAAQVGVPVVYFISPQLWAWRKGRIKQIRRRVRRMIVLFPFEEQFYREQGVAVTFSGHPLAEAAGARVPTAEARRVLELPQEGLVIGLLPGSRRSEIGRHLGPMLEAAARIAQLQPGTEFVVPVAETLERGLLLPAVERARAPVKLIEGDFERAVDACDAAIVASGTATLEVAIREVPPVVVYRTSPLTWWIGTMAVRVPHVSLVNLVAERELVPELLQRAFTPERTAAAVLELALPGARREQVLEGLRDVRRRLGNPGAYRRAAGALIEVLEEDGALAPRGGSRGQEPE